MVERLHRNATCGESGGRTTQAVGYRALRADLPDVKGLVEALAL